MARPTSPDQIERDLNAAQEHGRWLGEDEIAQLDEQDRLKALASERAESIRLRLMVLTGVCILLPPLWPLALALTLYLLFPKSITRIGVVAGVFLIALTIVAVGLISTLMIWLMTVLF